MTRLSPTTLAILVFLICCSVPMIAVGQKSPIVLEGAELRRVVPPGFYFQGQSAPTQIRNAAAARFSSDRFVIVAMVDTSGYGADVRAKYEGFFITDSAVAINGKSVATGAYGFGFTKDGKLNILDLAGREILSVSTTKDKGLKGPRPLMMVKSGDGVRIYSGRDYAVVTAE